MNNRKSCISVLAEILEEIENLPSGPFWIRDMREHKYIFPISLDAGNGQVIRITYEIDQMINKFSKILMDELFQSRKSEFTDIEWTRIIKRVFGNVIADYDKETNVKNHAEKILESIEGKVDKWIEDIQEFEHVFGCHICNVTDLEPLSIGPVCFEPRLVWLERMENKGHVSKISRPRIERSWKGEKIRKRKSSKDEMHEWEILNTIGNSDFVCSVVVGPMGSEAGLQRALIAARLAMTAIALVFSKPSSALNVMNLTYDRQQHDQHYMAFSPTRGTREMSSWSFLPGGITWVSAEKWVELRSKSHDLFDCIGQAIWYATHGPSKVEKPRTMEVIFQTLLWFHEGCRESMDSMAIVKFVSSMEAISGGAGVKGILNLSRANLRIKDDIQFDKDVKTIYGMGRSRTVHGTNDRLMNDWSHFRNYSEILAQALLISFLDWVIEKQKTDDPKIFSQLKT